MAFLQAGSSWFLLTVESAPCGWGWATDLSRFSCWVSLCLCSGGWNWISSPWSSRKCPIVSFGVSMGLAWLWAACLLMFSVVFLFCWRINMVCLALELAHSRVEFCFSVGVESWGLTLVYYCSLGSGVLWCFKVLDLSLLPVTFSPSLKSVSRFFYSYSTGDKIPRLMVKKFSTARNTQRDSQSYIEQRRGRREIEEIKWRKGGVKSGKRNLARNQIPKCSPQTGTPREVHRVM